jgi:hypothetical protein
MRALLPEARWWRKEADNHVDGARIGGQVEYFFSSDLRAFTRCRMDKKEPVPAGGFKTAPKGLEKSYFPVSQCADLGSGKELGTKKLDGKLIDIVVQQHLSHAQQQ